MLFPDLVRLFVGAFVFMFDTAAAATADVVAKTAVVCIARNGVRLLLLLLQLFSSCEDERESERLLLASVAADNRLSCDCILGLDGEISQSMTCADISLLSPFSMLRVVSSVRFIGSISIESIREISE